MNSGEKKAAAQAHPNIALVKYWGKRDPERNIPAVGSISVTLAGMRTLTRVCFDQALNEDRFFLNGAEAPERDRGRVSRFLDRVRQMAGTELRAEVLSENDFPTGAGLASSASGFAALALAATSALGLNLDRRELSRLARLGSGSAARSIFGGFVEMKIVSRGGKVDAYAEQLAPPQHWPLKVLVAVVSERPKDTGSTQGMLRSAATSPFYAGWVKSSGGDLEEMRRAIAERNFALLGEVAEHSCLKMHALMMSSRPPLLYWRPETVKIMETVWEMRRNGIPAYFTIDAGPQVKVICEAERAEQVKNILENLQEIQNIIECALGEDANLIEEFH